MVAIINYKAGNIRSVVNALHRIGFEATLTADPNEVSKASHVIFPGVGEAGSAMKDLQQSGMDEAIRSIRQPFLGICLGMQLLCESSEEQNTAALGLLPLQVKRFPLGEKVPHMGWNCIQDGKFGNLPSHPLFKGIRSEDDFYFVHSYAAEIGAGTLTITDYLHPFSSAVESDNFLGVQFHPEKSSEPGEKILRNFLSL